MYHVRNDDLQLQLYGCDQRGSFVPLFPANARAKAVGPVLGVRKTTYCTCRVFFFLLTGFRHGTLPLLRLRLRRPQNPKR